MPNEKPSSGTAWIYPALVVVCAFRN